MATVAELQQEADRSYLLWLLDECKGKRIQSPRGVGSVKGYPYKAWGVYEVTESVEGYYYWKLVDSGRKYRSDVREKHAFNNIVKMYGITHGTKVKLAHLTNLLQNK